MHYLCTHLRYLGRVVRHQSAKLGTAVRFCKVPQQKRHPIGCLFLLYEPDITKKEAKIASLSFYYVPLFLYYNTLSPNAVARYDSNKVNSCSNIGIENDFRTVGCIYVLGFDDSTTNVYNLAGNLAFN